MKSEKEIRKELEECRLRYGEKNIYWANALKWVLGED